MGDMSNTLFGTRIKEIREAKGISQAELARRLGHVSNSYVRDIERSVFTPPKERLGTLARALGVPVAQLEEILLEARLRDLGMKDPDFVGMLKDYKQLSSKDREAILKTYWRIKRSKNGPRN